MKPTLRAGDTGAAVTELQVILVANGYEGVPDNGVMDAATVAALELFQLQHIGQDGKQLVSDGVCGPKTWWALEHPSGEPQRNHIAAVTDNELTQIRAALLLSLKAEHAKPVFEQPDGSNRSKDIDRYFAGTGVLGKAWCCAFVSRTLKDLLGKNPIGGRYFLGVQAMYVDARDLGLIVQDPKPGDVFVQIKTAGQGHTGFVVGVSADGKTIYTCEGNCGNRLKMGRRWRDTIHYFIDPIDDGQGLDFTRRPNAGDDSAGSGTR